MRILISPLSLLSVIAFLKHACTVNHKHRLAIELDLSSRLPEGIAITQSEMGPMGTYYYVKTTFSREYRIGIIRDGDDIIMPENEDDMCRFLFHAILENNINYMRIVSKFVRFGKTVREISEFTKKPGDEKYRRLNRKTVDLEVITQQNTRTVHVEEEVSSRARFSVRKEVRLESTIGVVRYCCYIVNHRVHDLIERRVTWEGGHEAPVIIITSWYAEGYCLTTRHVFKGIGKGFQMDKRLWAPIFVGPKDEPAYGEPVDNQKPKRASRRRKLRIPKHTLERSTPTEHEPCTSTSRTEKEMASVIVPNYRNRRETNTEPDHPPAPDTTEYCRNASDEEPEQHFEVSTDTDSDCESIQVQCSSDEQSTEDESEPKRSHHVESESPSD